MTPTEEKPKRAKKEKPESLSIFVSRERLGSIISLRPPPEDQRETIRTSIIHVWPKVYEMLISDDLTAVLKSIEVAWTITKDAPRSKGESTE
jgi:hypothetical protein